MDDRVAEIVRCALGRPPRAARLLAGGQCDVFAVSVDADDDYFLKLARDAGGRTRLAREAIVYAMPSTPWPRPRLVASDGDAGWLLTASAGPTTLARRVKSPGDLSPLFREMGRLLRVMHETTVDALPPGSRNALVAGRADVEAIVRRDAVGRFERCGDGSPGHAARWPAFAALVEATIASGAASSRLLHGDYNTRQIILDADATRVTAVLDYEYACLGDPALDLLRMELSGVRGREAFYAGYGPRPVGHERLFELLDAMDLATRAVEAPEVKRDALTRVHALLGSASRPIPAH